MFNFGAFGSGIIWSVRELPLYIIVSFFEWTLVVECLTRCTVRADSLQIGAYGGLQGGAFNNANKMLSRWRLRHVPVASPYRRFLEVLVLTAFFSTVTFGLSYAYSSCLSRPPPDSTAPYISDLVSFYCPDRSAYASGCGVCACRVSLCTPCSDYNELASLFMVSSEVSNGNLCPVHFSKPDLCRLAWYCRF